MCVCVCVCVCVGQADFTPLMFCAYHGHALVAEALIEAGCDVNASASVSMILQHLILNWSDVVSLMRIETNNKIGLQILRINLLISHWKDW